MRNLHKVQGGQGVNTPGIPEIPRLVFEELLVNSLVHRDYMINAPIRIMMFSNRLEIISPGDLPNHLTVAKIQTGNSIIRNPILASYVAKNILPYRGLGSGIPRALDAWPDIELGDDKDGRLFGVTIRKKVIEDKGFITLDEQAAEQATEQEKRLIKACITDTMTAQELMDSMDLKHRPSFLYSYLRPTLAEAWVSEYDDSSSMGDCPVLHGCLAAPLDEPAHEMTVSFLWRPLHSSVRTYFIDNSD